VVTRVFRAQAGEASFVVHGFITATLEIEGEHRMLDPRSLKFQDAVKIEPPRPEVQEQGSL
jgi:predicted pyridoxine 5'-phosphate oxidase superfamily flavin-nucleotide-binding protein